MIVYIKLGNFSICTYGNSFENAYLLTGKMATGKFWTMWWCKSP